MRVVALSDTHTSKKNVGKLIDFLRHQLEGADHILHAGDIISIDLVEALQDFAPVQAVAGNMDPPDVRSRLPEKTTIKLLGFEIGLIHGWGSPHGLEEKVTSKFVDDHDQPLVDMIVFGHSHRPLAEVKNGLWLVNPGSAVARMFSSNSTLAVIELGNEIGVELLKL